MSRLILSLLTTSFVISCNYRTPSKIRFSENCGISIPDSITVISDRYVDSGPDYGIFYKIQLNPNDCKDIISQMEKSDLWEKSAMGYTFYKTENGTIYSAEFIEKDCKLHFMEELI